MKYMYELSIETRHVFNEYDLKLQNGHCDQPFKYIYSSMEFTLCDDKSGEYPIHKQNPVLS